jgi:hypothetical protein
MYSGLGPTDKVSNPYKPTNEVLLHISILGL